MVRDPHTTTYLQPYLQPLGFDTQFYPSIIYRIYGKGHTASLLYNLKQDTIPFQVIHNYKCLLIRICINPFKLRHSYWIRKLYLNNKSKQLSTDAENNWWLRFSRCLYGGVTVLITTLPATIYKSTVLAVLVYKLGNMIGHLGIINRGLTTDTTGTERLYPSSKLKASLDSNQST